MYELPMTVGMVPNLGSPVTLLEPVVTVLGVVCLALAGVLVAAISLAIRRRSSTEVSTNVTAPSVALPKAA